MSHAIERTSPKGGPFLGTCIKCGQTALGMGAALEPCPKDGLVNEDDVLVQMVSGETLAYKPENSK